MIQLDVTASAVQAQLVSVGVSQPAIAKNPSGVEEPPPVALDEKRGIEVMTATQFCRDLCNTPPKFNSSPLKNDGWEMILSFWVSVTFQGRTVKLQVSKP